MQSRRNSLRGGDRCMRQQGEISKSPNLQISKFGFISVGAVCQRVFRVCVEAVVLSMLRLKCLVKRREALRGRNLSRDSQVKGAPTVHPASGVLVAPEAVFLAPAGHPCHASENPPSRSGQTLTSGAFATSLCYRPHSAVARLAASSFLSGAAATMRRGGCIHLCAVTGRGGRNAAACLPG